MPGPLPGFVFTGAMILRSALFLRIDVPGGDDDDAPRVDSSGRT
jgi:hypothetical protein